jgi:hypothetical protein
MQNRPTNCDPPCAPVFDPFLILLKTFIYLRCLSVFRKTDPDSVKYRPIGVFGVRREVRGSAVENNKHQLSM